MADVEYGVETRFEGDDELRRAAAAVEDVGDAGKRAMQETDDALGRAKKSWTEFKSQVDVITGAFGTVKDAASGVYDALAEGAALSDARGDFADLSAEINTTADALENRLRQATGGLITDAQLIGDASNLMALNLGLTEDEIVAFSGAAAELDWNMEALADTLNTGATRGLKEMGLSISDVKGRMAELEEQGIATDQAFRTAILEAAEEKIGRVGKKSEETAGQLQALQTTVINAGDSFKQAFAESMVAGIDAAVDSAELLDDAIQRTAISAGTLLGNLSAVALLQFGERAAIQQLEEMGADMAVIRDRAIEINRATGAPLIELGTSPQDLERVTARYAMMVDEIERLQAIQDMINAPIDYPGPPEEAIRGIRDYADAMGDFVQASNQNAFTPPSIDPGYYQETYGGLYEINQALIDQMTYARDTADAWGAYTAAITSRGGDIFADFIDSAGQAREAGEQWAFDLNQAIFDAANNEGAGADFLGGFAENIGAAAEDIAAAMQAAQQQSLVTDLAAGVREAGISWSEFPGIVEQAMAELEGTTARPPIIRPELDEIGFRREMENSLPDTNEPIVVPLEVQLREDLITTAVDNARGVVEGFTKPAEVYQAVMEMDITAVETGTADAVRLINGVPTLKTVTINWRQSGDDVIAALRALGII